MKYYFCVIEPYENTDITEYDTLEDLKKAENYYMNNHNNWYVIKGKEIEI